MGFEHFWAQADGLSHAVAWLLLLMSLASWYFVLHKAWRTWRTHRTARVWLPRFWQAGSMDDALRQLQANDPEKVFAPLAQRGLATLNVKEDSLEGRIDRSELLTRALRNEINRVSARLESGLTLLASVGATAPFVGLLGTVWGIYHALAAIAGAQQIMIEQIAGPVGEALIMTAAGLVVAIPAVLAYNFLTRANRVTLAEVDGFAHDLHAFLTTGGAVKNT
jgi:biopolymer transport protein ExbB